MLRAAETGNIDAVKRELTGHTDVNSQDEVVFLSLVSLYCYGVYGLFSCVSVT